MINYSNGVTEDFEDIIDFKELLPKLYGGKIDTSSNYFLVKDKILVPITSFLSRNR